MKKIIHWLKYQITILLIAVCIAACAQEKYGVKRIIAFKWLQMPGNIPVDANGNSLFKGPDTIRTVYVETTGKGIVWDKAWSGGKTFSITTEPITTATYAAGQDKQSSKQIVLTPGKGSKQWLLELIPLDKADKLPVKSLNKGELLLRGKYGKQIITQIIKQYTELQPLPVY